MPRNRARTALQGSWQARGVQCRRRRTPGRCRQPSCPSPAGTHRARGLRHGATRCVRSKHACRAWPAHLRLAVHAGLHRRQLEHALGGADGGELQAVRPGAQGVRVPEGHSRGPGLLRQQPTAAGGGSPCTRWIMSAAAAVGAPVTGKCRARGRRSAAGHRPKRRCCCCLSRRARAAGPLAQAPQAPAPPLWLGPHHPG